VGIGDNCLTAELGFRSVYFLFGRATKGRSGVPQAILICAECSSTLEEADGVRGDCNANHGIQFSVYCKAVERNA